MGNENILTQNQRCSDCAHFMTDPAKPGFGFCFGVMIPADMNPKENDKCCGKYYKPK